MIKLSVVIVNYNVRYFLEQALLAVEKSIAFAHTNLQEFQSEVWVVDNASDDGSVELVQNKFPEAKLIANQENVGFSAANNQAIRQCSGEFVLLLNPDTVVEEETFVQCIQYMENNPKTGALGVKMVDGKGQFLPESKRSLPTPWISFCKIFGLSSLFPKSRIFGQYHLGFLTEAATNKVEVLPGAFMMMRKTVLDEIGLLDEDFFMYGEDIDLSYRVNLSGYDNVYFPEARIIHYKGESTKKGSLNYVRIFYQAMIIFANKHFSSGNRIGFTFFIQTAIYLRAIIALFSRFLGKLALPVVDGAAIFLGMLAIKEFWAANIKHAPEYYPTTYLQIVVPVYVLVWVFSVFISSGYDKPLRISKSVRGLLIGSLIIAIIYAFLPESLRFSRAIILLGTGWAIVATSLTHLFSNWFSSGSFEMGENRNANLIIVGSENEAERVLGIINQSGLVKNYIGAVTSSATDSSLGTVDQLKEIAAVFDIDEIIFCSRNISTRQIISWMVDLGPKIDYKTVPESSQSIIGSNSKNTAGDLYAVDLNLQINSSSGKRNKRLFDLIFGLLILFASPMLMWFQQKTGLFSNCLSVLFGKKSWVGYSPFGGRDSTDFELPVIKKGILHPAGEIGVDELNNTTLNKLNFLYARDYSTLKDLTILLRNWRLLGGN